MNLQRELINRIISYHHDGKRTNAVKNLSDLLSVGKDAIYRRIRGETLLTPDEILVLCQHYNLSLDSLLFQERNSVLFSFNAFSRKIKSFQDYLEDLKLNLEQFGQIPTAKVYYNTNEIPIFYYCFFRELISFKFYVWGRNIWNIDYLQNEAFHTDLIDHQVFDVCEGVLDNYLKVNTIEMWSLNLFDNTLNQIEYYASTGAFRREDDALMLCDKLEALVDHMSHMATMGKKSKIGHREGYGTLQLYHNEMISTNTLIYLKSEFPAVRVLFTIYGSPNFMKSTDERICDYTEEWIEKIMARSTIISENAARPRNWFFRGIKRRIEATRKLIQSARAELLI